MQPKGPDDYPPTAVGYPPTAVSYPPTVVGYPPTAIGYPSGFSTKKILSTKKCPGSRGPAGSTLWTVPGAWSPQRPGYFLEENATGGCPAGSVLKGAARDPSQRTGRGGGGLGPRSARAPPPHVPVSCGPSGTWPTVASACTAPVEWATGHGPMVSGSRCAAARRFFLGGGGGAGICFEREGGFRGNSTATAERLHSTVKAVWGRRLLAVGNAVEAGAGVWECLWGRVRAGVLGGGVGESPPTPQAIPWTMGGGGGGVRPPGARSTGHTRPTQAHTPGHRDGVSRPPTLRWGPWGLSQSPRPWARAA